MLCKPSSRTDSATPRASHGQIMHSAKYLTVFAGAYLLQLVYGRIQGVVKLYVHYKDLLISLSRDFNSFTGQTTDKTSLLRMRAGDHKASLSAYKLQPSADRQGVPNYPQAFQNRVA